MLWNLDPAWLMMAIATVGLLSYFFGSALHWVMREDGFGSMGNGLIVSTGFFMAILVANHEGYYLREIHTAVVVGLSGAFVCLLTLTALKALLNKAFS